MAKQQSSKWDLSRFLETLTYFEVIPFLGCLQRLFTGKEKELTQQTNLNKMAVFLIVGSFEPVRQKVVTYLLENNYYVRVLGENIQQAKDILGDQVELVEGDITGIESVMDRVTTIIYCGGVNLEHEKTDLDYLEQFVERYSSLDQQVIFDFTRPSDQLQEIWGALDDVVMGGVSKSQIQLMSNHALFFGNVSTDNSGGFASVRTRNLNPVLDLSKYQLIELQVKGDGNRYKFIIRDEDKWDSIGYCYSFETLPDHWITVSIPFNQLIPVFRAKTVPNAAAFNSSKVFSLQLMLSKFEYNGELNLQFSPGSFRLEIQSIKACGGELKPQLIMVDSQTIISPETLGITVK